MLKTEEGSGKVASEEILFRGNNEVINNIISVSSSHVECLWCGKQEFKIEFGITGSVIWNVCRHFWMRFMSS